MEETLLNQQEVHGDPLLSTLKVQPIVHVNQGVSENKLKTCVNNGLTLVWNNKNYEVLPEISKDFSEYDDLIDMFFS